MLGNLLPQNNKPSPPVEMGTCQTKYPEIYKKLLENPVYDKITSKTPNLASLGIDVKNKTFYGVKIKLIQQACHPDKNDNDPNFYIIGARVGAIYNAIEQFKNNMDQEGGFFSSLFSSKRESNSVTSSEIPSNFGRNVLSDTSFNSVTSSEIPYNGSQNLYSDTSLI